MTTSRDQRFLYFIYLYEENVIIFSYNLYEENVIIFSYNIYVTG